MNNRDYKKEAEDIVFKLCCLQSERDVERESYVRDRLNIFTPEESKKLYTDYKNYKQYIAGMIEWCLKQQDNMSGISSSSKQNINENK